MELRNIYLKELNDSKIQYLSKEDEYKLILLAKENNKTAISNLLTSNIFFIIKFCNSFTKDNNKLMDIYQVASMAYIEAIHTFDLSKDVRLITYAQVVMRGQVLNYISNDRLIKTPRYLPKLIKNELIDNIIQNEVLRVETNINTKIEDILKYHKLTEDEKKIMRLKFKGYSYREIKDKLNIDYTFQYCQMLYKKGIQKLFDKYGKQKLRDFINN